MVKSGMIWYLPNCNSFSYSGLNPASSSCSYIISSDLDLNKVLSLAQCIRYSDKYWPLISL